MMSKASGWLTSWQPFEFFGQGAEGGGRSQGAEGGGRSQGAEGGGRSQGAEGGGRSQRAEGGGRQPSVTIATVIYAQTSR